MKASARSISSASVLVLHAGRGVLDEVGVPAVHLRRSAKPPVTKARVEVQGRGRGVVDLQQPLRVRLAGLGA